MSLWQRLTGFFRGTSKVDDPNAHIREYLDHYLSLQAPPNYAVMLTGPWGSGKTYLIKDITRNLKMYDKKHVYVSLYGTRTKDEFDRAVLSAMYPRIYGRITKFGSHIASALLSVARINIKFNVDDYLKKFNADLFIFDDFERCDMKSSVVLGYINPFVEHGGCKAIVITNEAEIDPNDLDDYRRKKEKVIGQTLALTSDFNKVLPKFIKNTPHRKTRTFLESNIGTLHNVIQQSNSVNLRIIQQCLWDFNRFYTALPETYFSRPSSIEALLAPFIAFATEFKSGRIDRETLQGRTLVARVLSRSRESDKTNPFDAIANRYVGIDLTDRFFSDDLLIEMFQHGRFKTESIQLCLDRSPLFTGPKKLDDWRIIWEKEICEDDEVREAITEMESNFKKRSYVDYGIILHVFGLRLRLCDEGLLPLPRATAVAECIMYVDDLKEKGILPPLEISHNMPDTGSYAGLGFVEKESNDFIKIQQHLIKRQNEALEASYPAKARELLSEMAANDGLFWRRINYSNTGDTRYAQIPIFSYISATDFVDELFNLPNYRQRSILFALKNRIEGDRNIRALQSEHNWLSQVRAEMLKRVENSSTIAKIRVQHVIDWTIGPILDSIGDSE